MGVRNFNLEPICKLFTKLCPYAKNRSCTIEHTAGGSSFIFCAHIICNNLII
jgi:hypothetical protein